MQPSSSSFWEIYSLFQLTRVREIQRPVRTHYTTIHSFNPLACARCYSTSRLTLPVSTHSFFPLGCLALIRVSIHLHVRGATKENIDTTTSMGFQLTYLLTKHLKIRLKVSIHFLFFVTRFDRLVSIHIPTREIIWILPYLALALIAFQSTYTRFNSHARKGHKLLSLRKP